MMVAKKASHDVDPISKTAIGIEDQIAAAQAVIRRHLERVNEKDRKLAGLKKKDHDPERKEIHKQAAADYLILAHAHSFLADIENADRDFMRSLFMRNFERHIKDSGGKFSATALVAMQAVYRARAHGSIRHEITNRLLRGRGH